MDCPRHNIALPAFMGKIISKTIPSICQTPSRHGAFPFRSKLKFGGQGLWPIRYELWAINPQLLGPSTGTAQKIGIWQCDCRMKNGMYRRAGACPRRLVPVLNDFHST